MAPPDSSAKPQELFRYSDRAVQIDRDLLSESYQLAPVLDHFEASCREYAVQVSHLDDELRGYAREAEQVDFWVRQVGKDFEEADRVRGWWTDLPTDLLKALLSTGGFFAKLSGRVVLPFFISSFGAVSRIFKMVRRIQDTSRPITEAELREAGLLGSADLLGLGIVDTDIPFLAQLKWLVKSVKLGHTWRKAAGDLNRISVKLGPLAREASAVLNRLQTQLGALFSSRREDQPGPIQDSRFEKPIREHPEPVPRREQEPERTSPFGEMLDQSPETETQPEATDESTPVQWWVDVPVQGQKGLKLPNGKATLFGCTPTAVSMILHYWHEKEAGNKTMSAQELLEENIDDGEFIEGKGLSPLNVSDDLEGYKVEPFPGSNQTKLKHALKSGPVLAIVKLGMKTSGDSHAVVVTGISADGQVRINDPWTGLSSTYSWKKFSASWGADFGKNPKTGEKFKPNTFVTILPSE